MESTIKDFLFHCIYEKNLSNKTLKAYEIDIKQFKDFIHLAYGPVKLKDISREMIKVYIKSLATYKPKTIKRKIATIKAMFNFVEFEDDDFTNPFRKIRIKLKEPLELPVVMSLNDIRELLETAYKAREAVTQKDRYAFVEVMRDLAVLELLFGTGIRVSELCNLKIKDIDLNNRYIVVNGKGRKERLIQICNAEVMIALISYKKLLPETKPEYFFFINRLGKKLSEQSVRFMINKYVKQTGITKHITPHTFRHSFATLLLEQDVDIKYIQHLLGHSSILTTQIYTHINLEKQKELLTLKHPREQLHMS